jgi:hypothetical protein
LNRPGRHKRGCVLRLSKRCEDRCCNYKHQNRFVLHVESPLRVELSQGAQLRAPAWVRTGLVRGNEEVIFDLCKGGKSWGTTWPNWGELPTTPIACQAEKVKVSQLKAEEVLSGNTAFVSSFDLLYTRGAAS